MPTGACGINCDVCLLKVLESCSSCGAATSNTAQRKMEAQMRVFGGTCPILKCCSQHQKSYCMRDCRAFPCPHFSEGPYPFSHGFLNMQTRRRQTPPVVHTPDGRPVSVSSELWDLLNEKDPSEVSMYTMAEQCDEGYTIRFLDDDYVVDRKETCLKLLKNKEKIVVEDPALLLLTLTYLTSSLGFNPTGTGIIGLSELKNGHYFEAHPPDLSLLFQRFSKDPHGFCAACESLGGKKEKMADISYRLTAFPRLPVFFLYFKGNGEFNATFSILFDKTAERFFPSASLWLLVKRVAIEIIRGKASSYY